MAKNRRERRYADGKKKKSAGSKGAGPSAGSAPSGAKWLQVTSHAPLWPCNILLNAPTCFGYLFLRFSSALFSKFHVFVFLYNIASPPYYCCTGIFAASSAAYSPSTILLHMGRFLCRGVGRSAARCTSLAVFPSLSRARWANVLCLFTEEGKSVARCKRLHTS